VLNVHAYFLIKATKTQDWNIAAAVFCLKEMGVALSRPTACSQLSCCIIRVRSRRANAVVWHFLSLMRSRKRKDGRHENDDSASEHTTDNRLQMLAALCQMITSKLMLAWNGFGYIKTAEVLTVVRYL